MNWYMQTVAAAAGLVVGAASSFAETAGVNTGGGFAPPQGLIAVQQNNETNVAGVAESRSAAPAQITQSGLFNRAAVVQIYGTNSADVSQTGPYGRTELIQIGTDNTVQLVQNGVHATNTLIQSATSPAGSSLGSYSQTQLQTLVNNLLFAPDSVAMLPAMGEASGRGFAESLLTHLALPRGSVCANPLPGDGYAAAAQPQDCGLMLFADLGARHARQSPQMGTAGYDTDAAAITGGAEVRLTSNFVVGPAFNYTRASAGLEQKLGRNALDAYQLGAFAAFDQHDFFAHGVFTYGFDHYDVQRSGVGTSSTAHPSGDALVAEMKAGYLTDLGWVQAGPIAGLAYSSGTVNAFAENGGSLFTQTVGHQGDETLQGSAGGRLRTASLFGCLDAFVDLTAERDLRVRKLRTVATAFDFAPNQTLLTPVQAKPQTYGRVAGGVIWQLLPGTRVGLSGSTTFARESGDAYGVQADVRTQF